MEIQLSFGVQRCRSLSSHSQPKKPAKQSRASGSQISPLGIWKNSKKIAQKHLAAHLRRIEQAAGLARSRNSSAAS